tara:strand:- start:80 stop:247 length:168 start_codon:yes stop_codon:yes gene_type:complete
LTTLKSWQVFHEVAPLSRIENEETPKKHKDATESASKGEAEENHEKSDQINLPEI